jgi:hypothetical protein
VCSGVWGWIRWYSTAGTVLEGEFGGPPVPNGTIIPHSLGQPFHLWSPGTIFVPVWDHFVALCAVWCCLGLDFVVGPPPPQNSLWKVVEVLPWHQMELPPHHGFELSLAPLGSGVTGTILVPVGSLWWFSVQCDLVWGWIRVVGPHHHLEQFGRWWGYPLVPKWNHSS